MVNIDKAGHYSDSGIYAASRMGLSIDENLLGYPNYERSLPGNDSSLKIFVTFFLEDEGFALKKNLM